jgi:hypothetical protein
MLFNLVKGHPSDRGIDPDTDVEGKRNNRIHDEINVLLLVSCPLQRLLNIQDFKATQSDSLPLPGPGFV